VADPLPVVPITLGSYEFAVMTFDTPGVPVVVVEVGSVTVVLVG
jgi:hypothetical protein